MTDCLNCGHAKHKHTIGEDLDNLLLDGCNLNGCDCARFDAPQLAFCTCGQPGDSPACPYHYLQNEERPMTPYPLPGSLYCTTCGHHSNDHVLCTEECGYWIEYADKDSARCDCQGFTYPQDEERPMPTRDCDSCTTCGHQGTSHVRFTDECNYWEYGSAKCSCQQFTYPEDQERPMKDFPARTPSIEITPGLNITPPSNIDPPECLALSLLQIPLLIDGLDSRDIVPLSEIKIEFEWWGEPLTVVWRASNHGDDSTYARGSVAVYEGSQDDIEDIYELHRVFIALPGWMCGDVRGEFNSLVATLIKFQANVHRKARHAVLEAYLNDFDLREQFTDKLTLPTIPLTASYNALRVWEEHRVENTLCIPQVDYDAGELTEVAWEDEVPEYGGPEPTGESAESDTENVPAFDADAEPRYHF